MTQQVARFTVGEKVTILVGSHAGDLALVEHVVWSDRDRCHYFYLHQPTNEPPKKLSRGYRADEIGEPTLDLDSLG
jgi:hypothetical protein